MYQYMANQYKTNTYQTSPQQLVLMCYDGMVSFLNKAKEAIEKKDVESKTRYINKTLAIVAELQSSLNFELGGEVARNLDRIYEYFSRELLQVSIKNDTMKLDHVVKLMHELRGGWAKVASESNSPPENKREVFATC